ncbi:ATP-binding cassette domain-containing protein [Cellulomonas sp. zg-ZUI222]|uniref:ATP-binding cassette domain-containing protein n=1 Tax=Cellulomonas wangleii TaxID=2816956 RepID=A0ABX8D837_9CELL|nr:ATP-binding cassette domain-containing protein [Cellulomonas wangleii]MBO0921494.1 ATP-binding cassette domain-containing protein [Cellulomonas wangleii]MBO0924990.1 ATP-binding cassette domain-containing protein [Cellulomonas wangleii]QVI63589.1 ATP-binding cassette domain-containing protein [Cellulomonas wangleii]
MLELVDVHKVYRVGTFGGGTVHAVRGVSFDVRPGEVVSLIGESGSGKSTIGRMVLRLANATSGSIRFDGTDVVSLRHRGLRDYYRHAQGVFQDPFSSYNPIFKVDRTFDTLRRSYFPQVAGREWDERVHDAVHSVGLEPAEVLGKFPHQLSGGQLQRLLIARALLLDLRLLVADEIISMLDASTRIDVLNLLGDLKDRGLGILFVTHDLSLGSYVSDKVVILHQGRVVERGATAAVFADPRHPYTRTLLASVPQLDRRWEDMEADEERRAAALGDRCLYHEQVGADAPDLGLAEVAPDHLVGCFRDAADATCPGVGATVAG